MGTKSKKLLLLLLFSMIYTGCTMIGRGKITPPMERYVKVIHTVDILECNKTKSNICAPGTYLTTGSGMGVDLSAKYSQGFILTAGHVCNSLLPDSVKKSTQYNHILDGEGNLHDAHMLLSSQGPKKGVDLCILYVPTLEKKGVRISSAAPRVGDQVYYVGSPAGVYHAPVAPILTGIFSGNVDKFSAMVTVPAMGGSSGGAVLNQENKVIGVLWAAHPKFHHISLMSNFNSFHKFLSQARRIISSI